MVRPRELPSAQSDIQSMRHFYQRIGKMQQNKHSHEVYRKAADTGIVEEDIIRDKKEDPERRLANLTLRRLALAHSVDYASLGSADIALPPALRDERVLKGLEDFSKLTELERSGAPIEAYSSVLNNGKRSLALLIKLADYAVTHDTENQLEGFIDDGKPSLIRRYSSVDEAHRAMKMDAVAGERLYAPVAELFGYPHLAGDIFLHSFRVNHPEIYGHVLSSMQDPLTKLRMAETKRLGAEFAKVIGGVLRSYGFDAEVTIRKEKHDGKKMNKVLRLLKEDFDRTEEGKKLLAKVDDAKRDTGDGGAMRLRALSEAYSASLEQYVRKTVSSFDFERFNDWVAVRAVIHRFRGRSIDEQIEEAGAQEGGFRNGRAEGIGLDQVGRLLDEINAGPLRIAVRCVSNAIMSLGDLYGDMLGRTDSKALYYNKPNGYRAFHFDSRPDGKGSSRILPFEIQLKTARWHAIAEHGEAAHHFYLGGDKGFVDMIANAYHDLIHPQERPRSNGARKSSPYHSVPELSAVKGVLPPPKG